MGRNVPHGPPVGQHDVPRTDEEGFEQEGKPGIDPGGARGRALRRPDEGLLREDEKDPPQQHRYHARCEQDDQDNLAHADKQGSVQGQKRETLSEKA